MTITLKQLRALVESHGGTLEVEVNGYHREYFAVAPDGHHWREGDCINMLGTYHVHFPECRQEVLDDLAKRIPFGTRPCTDPDCGCSDGAADPQQREAGK